ncbi:hypothetical protein XccvBFoX7_gp75c [Xanthomonas phage FoX7]|uniref:Uncharacterized protein n=2 Tax=Carpasinavirus XcP1 TaxID=2182344 RepID=A0A858NR34_9CAUD|nr:hypothetical protein XccvBFoX6_gp75c [Xanthomonas phage FoX6]QJB22232.1 hypothetical protein XccvBFoX7_gp75c [Xanthomonas phage FoX7]
MLFRVHSSFLRWASGWASIRRVKTKITRQPLPLAYLTQTIAYL